MSKEHNLQKEKQKNIQKGAIKSLYISMALLSSGLLYTLHDTKTGIIIMTGSIIPLVINPEVFSNNKQQDKEKIASKKRYKN